MNQRSLQTAVAIRPRRPWEAVDLGVRMARRWWRPMVRIWLILTLPLLALLHLLPRDYLWIPPLVLWWTKPLWERALLYILSQALFAHVPTTWETLKAFPAQARRQIIPWLTWRRLTPYRSMDMPVTQLEGLNGQRRSERVLLLRRQDSRPAGWLTVIGIHLESFFGVAMILLVWAMVPSTVEINVNLSLLVEPPWVLLVAQNLVAYLAAAIVAPFYVATGFALYLNRRIRLEGWDLEVVFRQMVQKRGGAEEKRSGVAAAQWTVWVLSGLMVLAASHSPPAVAAGGELTPEVAREEIQVILAGESFHETKTLRRLAGKEEQETDAWDLSWLADWSDTGHTLATVLEIALWVVVIILLLIVVFRYRAWLEAFGIHRGSPVRVARPQTLFGLDVRPESLPEDVPAAARRLWREQPRAAFSLLYRASLVQLIDRGLEIRAGDTEGDCLRLAQERASEPAVAYLAELTRHWQRLAYAHSPPDEAVLEALCADWPSIWGGAETHG